ncbi:hypothetical protein, partial [Pseudomonas aeruginosa]|uniref:hypothetical protein n=1 Tax=Pseudomonas aeruginosa TaxID=287 RepID=UPI0021F0A5F1
VLFMVSPVLSDSVAHEPVTQNFGHPLPPVCLKGSKLLTITFNASALAANITGNVYDRFNRLSGSVLHDQYLLRRLRKGPSKSLKVVSLLQISLT